MNSQRVIIVHLRRSNPTRHLSTSSQGEINCGRKVGVSKTQTSKTQTPDPKNSDPRVSRKLRPEKLRPSGCLENSDPKNKTNLHRVNAASRLVYCSSIQWHYQNLPRKEKQLIVLDTCNDHENYLPRKERNSLQCWIRATIVKIILNIRTFFFSLSYIKSQVYIHNVRI